MGVAHSRTLPHKPGLVALSPVALSGMLVKETAPLRPIAGR
jgi:hypothetical protein